MRRRLLAPLGTTTALVLAITMTGCPRPPSYRPRPTPTPRTALPPPRIEARANPVFRLVVRGRSPDAAARLLVFSVRIENIHDESVVIRPDSISLELPSGITLAGLDRPRAAAIVDRTSLARADFLYLDDPDDVPPGGLSRSQQKTLRSRVRKQLLDRTELAAGESVSGFVVIDAKRRYRSLGASVIQVTASSIDPSDPTPYPVRVLLGAPIELAE